MTDPMDPTDPAGPMALMDLVDGNHLADEAPVFDPSPVGEMDDESGAVQRAEDSLPLSPQEEDPIFDTTAPSAVRHEIFQRIPEHEKFAANLLADWLAIPGDAKFLKLIIEGVNNHLPRLEEVADASFHEVPFFLLQGAASWHQALLTFKVRDPRLKDVMGNSGRPKNPTHGVQKSGQQLYACQPYFGAPTLETPFAFLQAQVMLAALRSWDVAHKRYFHGSITLVDAAAVSIRHLNNSELVSRLPAEILSQAGYLQRIAILLSELDDDEKEDKDELANIERLLRKVEDPDDDKLARDVQPEPYDDDELDLPAKVQIRKAVRISNETYADLILSGMPLEEMAGDIEEFMPGPTVLARSPDVPRQRVPTTAELVRNRNYQIAAMERANQRLPGAWSRLRRHEVSEWLHALSNLVRPILKKMAPWSIVDHEVIDMAIQMNVSFWTARSVAESARLILYASREHLPHQGIETIGFILASNQWCIPRLRPKARPLYRNVDVSLAEASPSILLLPAHPATARSIHRLETADLALRTGVAQAITTDALQRERLIDEFYDGLSPRTTRNRIAEYLFHRLSDLHGDVAAASLTLGHAHRLSDTALHYANYPQMDLAQTYEQVCAAIYDAAFEDHQVTVSNKTPQKAPKNRAHRTSQVTAMVPERPYSEPTERLGTEICPLPGSLKKLRENIHDAFGKVAADPGRTDHLAHHHNLFMLYTVFMLKVATGYRDVRAPLPRRSDIDRRDKTILVSDKDDVASFNSRILPLADMVAEQMAAVDAHLKVLASRLVLANSSLARDLYEQTGQIEGIRFNYPKIDQRAPPLFFLQRSGSSLRLEEIRPTTLKAYLTKHAPWFRLPTNANRAYVRNRLLNGIDSTLSGLPGNVVDYFMGHWVRGREPLGRFATHPVEGYIEMLRPVLNRLLECDGWSVIQGCHD